MRRAVIWDVGLRWEGAGGAEGAGEAEGAEGAGEDNSSFPIARVPIAHCPLPIPYSLFPIPYFLILNS